MCSFKSSVKMGFSDEEKNSDRYSTGAVQKYSELYPGATARQKVF